MLAPGSFAPASISCGEEETGRLVDRSISKLFVAAAEYLRDVVACTVPASRCDHGSSVLRVLQTSFNRSDAAQ